MVKVFASLLLLITVTSFGQSVGLIADFPKVSFPATSVNGSGGVAGLAQKADNTFQSFAGGVARYTNRGLLVEPASQNFVAFSSDFNNAGWAVSNSFTGKVAKTSLIPSQTAYEFESDGTAGLINQANRGTFSASPEILGYLVEAMPSATEFEFYIHDQTANLAVIRRSFNFATKTWTSFGGTGSAQKHGYIEFGTGPNGGQVYLLFIYATPPTAGNTRRFFVYPHGSTNTVSGKKVTIHHGQDELGTWTTSPIVNASTTSNTRAAEVITLAVPTGTYDVRYNLQDGTVVDRYGVSSVANVLTVPTDVTQQHAIWTGDVFTSDIQRNGYITSIVVWKQAINNIHGLGDSFLTSSGSSPGQIIPKYLPPTLYKPRIWTIDGVGGTSLTQQATRFDATPSFYGDYLVIVDGVIDGLSTTADYASIVKPAIESMIGHLTTSPKKWLYIQPNPDVNAGNIGSPYYTLYLAIQALIQADYPNSYVPTMAIMQAHGNGSANDNTDIANGQWPRSIRIASNDVHTNELGSLYEARIIDNAIQTKRP